MEQKKDIDIKGFSKGIGRCGILKGGPGQMTGDIFGKT
jgi:hypothetical protein